ncbi:MAG: hypothetical protein M1825_001904 [Sarcosagium campestre]|nr:MAG: hypothetical protein M1825_001904 [Sarcosagium campestre]
MSARSFATRQSVKTQMRALAQRGRPQIEISLQGQDNGSLCTFTTSDKLEGEIAITAQQDARFDDIQITFEGSVKTFVEPMTTASTMASRTEASHLFLKVAQPIEESAYPQPRIAEAGKTYRFPFTFIVPEQLLTHSCTHPCESNQVRDAHLRLPPSLGDQGIGLDGSRYADDMAPDMSRITYAIKVKVTRINDRDGKSNIIADQARKVRVIPAYEEAPPVDAVDADRDLTLRRERIIRKGFFKGKLGTLTMEAAQPKSLRLGPPSALHPCPVSTMATVDLRFDPASDTAPPPRLGLLAVKLKANTFFASAPMRDFPTRDNSVLQSSRGLYPDTLTLSSRCVESVKWEMHAADEQVRRPSVMSSLSSGSSVGSLPAPSSRYTGRTFYSARIAVPIAIPKSKDLPPTFYSCLVARTYQLDLSLSAQTPSASTGGGASLQLRVPIQISSTGNLAWAAARQRANEAAEALDDDDDDDEQFFRPRSIVPPSGDLLATSASVVASQLPPHMRINPATVPPPPGYSFFSGASNGVPVRIPSPVGISPGCG